MNLFDTEGEYIIKTSLTRKLTLDGSTKAYPVYRVRLECLFYNDQNDRIATYIGQFKKERGEDVFKSFNMQEYNAQIENFIVESNPAAIEKTLTNIKLVGQREPGVVLADGRVIDGNRRFTCLRKLAAEDPEFGWFETVILDRRLRADRKEIKMLELSIQHGEEKKVDYNPIDRLVGIYQDIIKTNLLTVQEYADSTNETVADVKKRIEQVQLLYEFLEYINLPEQFYVARDYQIVSILGDMVALLKRCRKDNEREALKVAIFNNIMMRTTGDARKFIRNLGKMIENNTLPSFLKKQDQIGKDIMDMLEEADPKTQTELDVMIAENAELAADLKNSMDLFLKKSNKRDTKAKPAKIVSESISLLKTVDTNILDSLNETETERLKENVSRLVSIVGDLEEKTGPIAEGDAPIIITKKTSPAYKIAERHIEEPMLRCLDMNTAISNLIFKLTFALDEPLPFQKHEAEYVVFFMTEQNVPIGEPVNIQLSSGTEHTVSFEMPSSFSEQSRCWLAIRSALDPQDALQQKIPFSVSITFGADFGF